MAERFITPEAVALRHEHAGLGSRFVALLVDSIIQTLVLVGTLLAADLARVDVPATLAPAVVIAVIVFLHLGYFAAFEALWEGRTPGKRMTRLRVLRLDGQPLGWNGALIRNVLRLVDSLFAYAVGAIVMLVSRDDQRLGDLAAGTIVIHEPSKAAIAPAPHASAAGWAARIDVAGVTEREYALARSFLQRRAGLSADARSRLAAEVATTLRYRVEGIPGDAESEEVIETVVAAVRER